MKLTEICKEVGIHKSKGHSILNTLSQFGLVEKDPRTKTYSLGTALIFLSRHVLDHLSYPDIVAPFLEDLARETGRLRAVESSSANQLVRMGYLSKKREGRDVYFFIETSLESRKWLEKQ